MLSLFSLLALILTGLGLGYLYMLVFASLKLPGTLPKRTKPIRFAVAIPAHDEAPVIARTVSKVLAAEYPTDLISVYVVADHCSDNTAQIASQAGAHVFERQTDERRGKGPALAWLFQRIFETGENFDAIIICDADTQMHPNFLTVMSARLADRVQVCQGNHIISNPTDGWFPSLTWAMFLIDNRIQNLGRANMGWSAKNMGDSICFRTEILHRYGWGDGLTEDYQFRQRLLLEGIRIAYEPAAIGYGEAALNWQVARAQRARWISGTYQSSRQRGWQLLKEGLRRKNAALLDGAAQALLPSYSTLTLFSAAVLVGHLLMSAHFAPWQIYAWAAVVVSFAVFPFVGLALERAPMRAYAAMLIGPAYILWRSWLSIAARFGKGVGWVRTARRSVLTHGVRE